MTPTDRTQRPVVGHVSPLASSPPFPTSAVPPEPATDKGMLAQSMRHMEEVMKTWSKCTEYFSDSIIQEMLRVGEQNDQFARQHVEFMNLLLDRTKESTGKKTARIKLAAGPENKHIKLPMFIIMAIEKCIRQHRKKNNGAFPSATSGPVELNLKITWKDVDLLLRAGGEELPVKRDPLVITVTRKPRTSR